MKVEELKNYGKPLSDIMLHPEVVKNWNHTLRRERGDLWREVGLTGMIKLVLGTRKEVKRMKSHDWSRLREQGLDDQRFLQHLIGQTAAMKALAGVVGMEKASEIYRRLIDKIGYDVTAPMFPSIEDFRACGDSFTAFKEYAKSLIIADLRAGLHELEIVEDTPGVLAYNVSYCTWYEVARESGVASLCYSARCHADEVFFHKIIPGLGARYTRTGTLATGAPVCDVRFELLSNGDAHS